jgi:acetyl esterase/lipase
MRIPLLQNLKFVFYCLLTSCSISLYSQIDYSIPNQFLVRQENDITYGTSIDYRGISQELKLDLYKPIGDNNTTRPIMILVHGGSFIAGCKDDMANLAANYAARGFMVASVDYRMGFHKDNYVPTPAVNSILGLNYSCLYAYDSLEVKRAVIRGTQDVKGAIRYLKNRHFTDSTSINCVYVGGESAGAIISLCVSLLDRPEEMPSACLAQSPVLAPSANLTNCIMDNCMLSNATLSEANYARPSLGSIEGDMNLNGYNSRVLGVMSLAGGIITESLTQNWLMGQDTALFYFSHWTCDAIVHYNYAQPMTWVDAICLNPVGYSQLHYNLPFLYGPGDIIPYLENIGIPAVSDIYNCAGWNTDIWSIECIRLANNGAYHYAAAPDYSVQRFVDMVMPCMELSSGKETISISPTLFPNPANQFVLLQSKELVGMEIDFIILMDLNGRTYYPELSYSGDIIKIQLPLGLSPGQYLLKGSSKNIEFATKFLIMQ